MRIVQREGRPVGRGALALALCLVSGAPASVRPSAAQDERPAATGAAMAEEERRAWRERESALLLRIEDLQNELAAAQARAEEHERTWTEWVRLLDGLVVAELPAPPTFLADALPGAPSEAEVERAAEESERSARALADLRALLMAEEVRDLDVLQIGTLQGEPGERFFGPVVVRLLDELSRPAGTLAADRLRLECSRTGWGITLVFEEGVEKRAGRTEPLGPSVAPDSDRGGIRRIHLPGLDPAPWIAAFPELLGDGGRSTSDDGLWDLLRVRQEINRLLAADARTGAWRLVGLGGVDGSALEAVHVVELDEQGDIVRRLFADHMRIRARGDHVEMELSDGIQERGGRRAPFLDNRYRIYLTGSSADAWKTARLPGLASPDRSPASADVTSGAGEDG